MSICYPPTTDWSCAFTEEELAELRATAKGALDLEFAEAAAWSLLASLTAYQIGTCPVTVRPCAARCAPSGTKLVAPVSRGYTSALRPGTIGMLNPYISGGVWYNACGCGTGGCACSSLPTVSLPGPVGGIVSVYVDGVLIPATDYRVDNGTDLVRLDGEPWPACQDMSLDDEAGFSVTYWRGAKPNVMTNRAAGELANEFYQACSGGECRLPNRVTSATRAGESYQFDPVDFQGGDTGIESVNAVVRIYNPFGLKAPVSMASPETVGVGGRMPTWRRR